MSDLIDRQAAIDAASYECHELRGLFGRIEERLKALPSTESENQHERIFQEIVVEYPPYTYKGKPYFSIKYMECGQERIGFGTFNPEKLSKYLKEYFMPSAQPERTGKWLPDNNFYYETRFVCSECKESECVPAIGFAPRKPLWDYCPNCGARMVEGDNETN